MCEAEAGTGRDREREKGGAEPACGTRRPSAPPGGGCGGGRPAPLPWPGVSPHSGSGGNRRDVGDSGGGDDL